MNKIFFIAPYLDVIIQKLRIFWNRCQGITVKKIPNRWVQKCLFKKLSINIYFVLGWSLFSSFHTELREIIKEIDLTQKVYFLTHAVLRALSPPLPPHINNWQLLQTKFHFKRKSCNCFVFCLLISPFVLAVCRYICLEPIL